MIVTVPWQAVQTAQKRDMSRRLLRDRGPAASPHLLELLPSTYFGFHCHPWLLLRAAFGLKCNERSVPVVPEPPEPPTLPPSFSPAPPYSRQRKNAYMKSLEMENRALKMENERLR